jgi:argonaute-like protein implicated in RNA metabolism and viral defense
MDAKKFLQDKGIIWENDISKNHKMILGGKGNNYDLTDLMEEYAILKRNEITKEILLR